jgi:hypothetical protein
MSGQSDTALSGNPLISKNRTTATRVWLWFLSLLFPKCVDLVLIPFRFSVGCRNSFIW